MLSPLGSKKLLLKQGKLISERTVWRGVSLSCEQTCLASLQQVSEQTGAEAKVATVKSICMQRGLEEGLSGLMWDGSG